MEDEQCVYNDSMNSVDMQCENHGLRCMCDGIQAMFGCAAICKGYSPILCRADHVTSKRCLCQQPRTISYEYY